MGDVDGVLLVHMQASAAHAVMWRSRGCCMLYSNSSRVLQYLILIFAILHRSTTNRRSLAQVPSGPTEFVEAIPSQYSCWESGAFAARVQRSRLSPDKSFR